ncbi:MAG: hypothetical protein FWH27_07300 [Planctomycetaceae bacterium]|nr:hypothetical protein [Planctomycetaceae bacterium]
MAKRRMTEVRNDSAEFSGNEANAGNVFAVVRQVGGGEELMQCVDNGFGDITSAFRENIDPVSPNSFEFAANFAEGSDISGPVADKICSDSDKIYVVADKIYVVADKTYVVADKIYVVADKTCVVADKIYVVADKICIVADQICSNSDQTRVVADKICSDSDKICFVASDWRIIPSPASISERI